MNEALLQCSRCERHVRVSEPRCPFCQQPREASDPQELRVEPFGLSRTALVALSASLALTGCDWIRAQVSPAPVYGGAPPSADAATTIVAPYGAPMPQPPVDASPAVMAVYGAPVPPPPSDAGSPLAPTPTPPRK